jgi:hypothetical protein
VAARIWRIYMSQSVARGFAKPELSERQTRIEQQDK